MSAPAANALSEPRIGEPDSAPSKVSIPIADMATGYLATITILAALQQVSRTQLGQQLDVSLYNSTLMLQQVGLSSYFATGEEPEKCGSAAPYAAPNEAFPTQDGWVMVAAYQPQRWRKLCEMLGLEGLASDERFASNSLRVANRAELNEVLGAAFKTRTTHTWIGTLSALDILCAPIATYREVTRSAQYRQSGVETYVDHPVAGRVRMPAFSIGDAQTAAMPNLPPPLLGEHSATVLAEYGLTAEEIDTLVSRGVVKTTSLPMPDLVGARS